MKKAIIVVDMINDFVTGKLGSPRARKIVPDIASLLKKLGVDTLIILGVSTDICVQNNVGHAYFSGYKTIVPEDCTASIDEKAHEQAIKYMKNIYGAQITSSDKAL